MALADRPQLFCSDLRFRFAAWGIVLLAMVHLCWLESRPGSEARKVCPLTTEFTARRAEMAKAEQFDRIADRTGNDNVLLTVAASAKTNPAVESYAEFYYYRISYALYPRRLYVAPPDKVINNGSDIRRTEFRPSQQWLREQDVRSVLIFGGDIASGRMLWLVSLQQWESLTGMQTNKPGGN
jgi:hypothetical protein